jgi:outer membrane lipoprotein-sorting protein
MNVWVRRTTALLALAAVTGLTMADSVEEVEKKIKKAGESVQSAQSKMKMTIKMEQAGQNVNADGTGMMEFAKKDGKDCYRVEIKTEMRMKMGEQEMKMEQEVLTVCDGEFAWSLSSQMGQKMVTKQHPGDADMNPGAEHTFKQLRESYELEMLADEKVNGADAWVIQGTPKKDSSAGQMGKVRYSFNQENGLLVKMVTDDQAGNPAITIEFTDIKLNPSIDASRFKFEAPDGVQVMDMTKSAGGDEPATP